MSKHHSRFRKGKIRRKQLLIQIFDRDRGICFNCGKDNVALLKDCLIVTDINTFLNEHKITPTRYKQTLTSANPHLWDMDHIIPASENGLTTLGNLRTVCCACHYNINGFK